MKTHTISEKVRTKIDHMYGPDKERVIKVLEMGKTVYKGKVKLRGVKVDKDEGSTAPAPPAPGKTSDPAKAVKDK